MNTLIHADIFFFVTTIVVVVVGAAFTVALIYLIKVLGDVRDITREVKAETLLFRGDIANLRKDITREGFRLERLIGFFKTLAKHSSAVKKPRSKEAAKKSHKQ
jgi:hypothetical protein